MDGSAKEGGNWKSLHRYYPEPTEGIQVEQTPKCSKNLGI